MVRPQDNLASAVAVRRRRSQAGSVAILVAGAAAALLLNRLLPIVSALMIAVVLGALVRNLGLLPAATLPGITAVSKWCLRAGVALLGLRLAIPDVINLGVAPLILVLVTVAVTFSVTIALGRCLKVSRGITLLIATGFSICGAAAIAAMSSVADTEDDEVAVSIALVTVYGSLAIIALPLLRPLTGFDDTAFGLWAGLSVHEVAQVVATASVVSTAALTVAVIAKLARVVLLAPLVAGYSALRRSAADVGPSRHRPPIVPLFVVCFLVAVGLRSTGLVPAVVLYGADLVSTGLLAVALFGLGVGVHLTALIRTGGRPLFLGAIATVVAMTVSWIGLGLL